MQKNEYAILCEMVILLFNESQSRDTQTEAFIHAHAHARALALDHTDIE